MNNKAQTTIFIILAVLIVAAVALFLIFRGSFSSQKVPPQFESIYTNFLSCLEEDVLVGVDLLETQAGYIELPEFEPGSQYSPFSSQLNLLGNPVPYWYYVSGNNLPKTQVPTKSEMESQLGDFIEQKILDCSFNNYYDEGFGVNFGKPEAKVSIQDDFIDVDLVMDMNLEFSGEEVLVRNHDLGVDSKLGELYDSAIKVYEAEQDNLFLEEYAIDNLRLYGPVDGVELSCSPKIWNADEVFDNIEDAVELNTLALGTNADEDYFRIDLPISNEVRFINSKTWSSLYEVNPSEGNVLIAKPVGNQPGLGALGFCYVSYHYVYNMKYPVLVQVYDDNSGETFQFPVAVVIEGNQPRESLAGSASEVEDIGLCENRNTETSVNVYDSNLNSLEADISYECFGSVCAVGSTESGTLETEFPQCVNGYVVARAEGYKEGRQVYSSVDSGEVNLVLDKMYPIGLDLKIDGVSTNDQAIISFISDEESKTVVYPSQEVVELIEGDYEIQVHVYSNSSIRLDETTYQQCIEVPRGAIGGIFGLTKERCFDVDAPSRIISSALIAGGKENYYLAEHELSGSTFMEINADKLKIPTSLDDIQQNYIVFETKGLEANFR